MNLYNIAKLDYNFEGFKIHNPSLKELFEVFETEEDMILVLQILTLPLRETLKLSGNAEITEFQLFQSLVLSQKEIAGITQLHKLKIMKFLLLLFPDYKLEIFNERFIFKKDDSVILIADNNFENFKAILSSMFDLKAILSSDEQNSGNFNPKNAQAKAIAEKLQNGRKKVAELKGETKGGIFENYLSVLSVGFGISTTVLSEELTLYSLIKTYKRFLAKIAWDMDIQCRLAGGTPQDSPENWMAMM